MPNKAFTKKWTVGDTRTAITDVLVDGGGTALVIPATTVVRFRLIDKSDDSVKIDDQL